MNSPLPASVLLQKMPPAPRLRRARVLRWLRTAHLYVGLWGAVAGLLLGLSGFLLNHRAVLKLPLERGERSVVQVEVVPAPGDPSALIALLAPRLGYEVPGPGGGPRPKVDPAAEVQWGGQAVHQPERWQISFVQPGRQAQVEYFVGNRFAKVERYDANGYGLLTRLHQSVGVDIGWVLLMDSIAGSFVFLALSGIVLWSQFRSRRVWGLLALVTPVATGLALLARYGAWS